MFSPLGDTELTVDGTGFSGSSDSVTLGGKAVTIVTSTDTSLQLQLPVLAPGSYPLMVTVPAKGLADTR